MTDLEVPGWFVEAFGDAHRDLNRDAGIPPSAMTAADPSGHMVRRAQSLWLAVVAHQASSPTSETAVDSANGLTPSPSLIPTAPTVSHPYEPATERPTMRERLGQTMTDLESDGVTAAARLGFPGPAIPQPTRRENHDATVRAYAPGMYVTREPADLSAPKVDCAECGGNGQRFIMDGNVSTWEPCPHCGGSGEVTAPVAAPRETGAAPEDSPLVQPPTAEELAAIEAARAPDDVVAAQVAAAKAGLAKMKSH